MSQISLIQDENLSLKLQHQLLPRDFLRTDLYFSLPVDMGINPSTLEEDDYFHSNIKIQCAYYSNQLHLPLVRSRFISQQKGEQADYRLNLNLFCYQIKIALDIDIKQALKIKEPDRFYETALEICEQTEALLKKLRRYTPPDKKLSPFFETADNYLSWHVEQSFLNLLSDGPKSYDHAAIRDKLFDLCAQEQQYRDANLYNTTVTLADPNRITNKMRLLQRLIEFGVVFQKETFNLNNNLRRLVKGLVTAVMMAFVMTLVLNARSNFAEVTFMLVALLGVIYGLREIFKDDATQLIWRWIQKGRPKWENLFSNSASQTRMIEQMIWLEYIKPKDLPPLADALLQKRRQQNKQDAQLLHFRCDSKVVTKEFYPGYDEIQQELSFNLTPFVRYLKKGEGKLYSVENKKISKQAVERRYQINVVVIQTNKKKESISQRFKITLNRSKIINIEAIADSDVEPSAPII